MSKWDLSEQEWEALDRARFGTTEAQVFRNATIILMTAAGRAKAGIAQDLGCSPATVDNVRQRYRQRGLAGLRRGMPPGRRSRATAVYRTALRQALQTPPAQLGYGFSVWSVARVGQHLKKTTGVGFSADHLRRLVHAREVRVRSCNHTCAFTSILPPQTALDADSPSHSGCPDVGQSPPSDTHTRDMLAQWLAVSRP
jgi:transposase